MVPPASDPEAELARLRRPSGPWLHLLDAAPADARQLGWMLAQDQVVVRILRGHCGRTAYGFFDEVGAALQLPGDPAEDWPGLAALLTDMGWLPGAGHVLVVTRAALLLAAEPQEALLGFVGAVREVARGRAEEGDPVPFHVVLQDDAAGLAALRERLGAAGAKFDDLAGWYAEEPATEAVAGRSSYAAGDPRPDAVDLAAGAAAAEVDGVVEVGRAWEEFRGGAGGAVRVFAPVLTEPRRAGQVAGVVARAVARVGAACVVVPVPVDPSVRDPRQVAVAGAVATVWPVPDPPAQQDSGPVEAAVSTDVAGDEDPVEPAVPAARTPAGPEAVEAAAIEAPEPAAVGPAGAETPEPSAVGPSAVESSEFAAVVPGAGRPSAVEFADAESSESVAVGPGAGGPSAIEFADAESSGSAAVGPAGVRAPESLAVESEAIESSAVESSESAAAGPVAVEPAGMETPEPSAVESSAVESSGSAAVGPAAVGPADVAAPEPSEVGSGAVGAPVAEERPGDDPGAEFELVAANLEWPFDPGGPQTDAADAALVAHARTGERTAGLFRSWVRDPADGWVRVVLGYVGPRSSIADVEAERTAVVEILERSGAKRCCVEVLAATEAGDVHRWLEERCHRLWPADAPATDGPATDAPAADAPAADAPTRQAPAQLAADTQFTAGPGADHPAVAPVIVWAAATQGVVGLVTAYADGDLVIGVAHDGTAEPALPGADALLVPFAPSRGLEPVQLRLTRSATRVWNRRGERATPQPAAARPPSGGGGLSTPDAPKVVALGPVPVRDTEDARGDESVGGFTLVGIDRETPVAKGDPAPGDRDRQVVEWAQAEPTVTALLRGIATVREDSFPVYTVAITEDTDPNSARRALATAVAATGVARAAAEAFDPTKAISAFHLDLAVGSTRLWPVTS